MNSKLSGSTSQTPILLDPLLTDAEAASALNLSVNTLAVWRCTNRKGPAYVKLGRTVRYPLSAISSYISNSMINPQEVNND